MKGPANMSAGPFFNVCVMARVTRCLPEQAGW